VGALGEIRDPRAIPALLEALKDENSNARQWSAAVLGEIKDLRAVEPLRQRLDDLNPRVREAAALALKELGVS
jgi:HEAT repeat protein